MTKENEKDRNDDLPVELHKALIECGAVIPTTPEEVALAERHLKTKVLPSQIEAAFSKLEESLDKPGDNLDFVKMNPIAVLYDTPGLALAARNGTELDEETKAKIDQTLKKIRKESSDDSKSETSKITRERNS